MMWNYPWMGYGTGGFSLLSFVFWWVLIILGIVIAVRWFRGGTSEQTNGTPSALEILKTRYAKGEIDRNEYEEKKSVLENGTSSNAGRKDIP